MRKVSVNSILILLLFLTAATSAQYCTIIFRGENCKINGYQFQLIEEETEDVDVFTVASDYTDGYERYIRSAKRYKINVKTLGMGEEWRGGNMNSYGGGYKMNLLKEALEPHKENKNKIIMFTDSYDVVFTSGVKDIINKFKNSGAKILFGAEHFCWPDETLSQQYPTTIAHGARYLNSGMFIGYASNIYEMLQTPIKDKDDDQRYFTKIYLDSDLRSKLGMKLDHKSDVFQNLNGAMSDVKLDINADSTEGTLINTKFLTKPSVIHGNGPSKVYLNAFANYLGGNFKNNNCQLCDDVRIVVEGTPTISLSVFVENPVPFFEEFLHGIAGINYPKSHINLFVHSNEPYHEEAVNSFLETVKANYKSIKVVKVSDQINEREARKLSVHQAIQKESDYFFAIDADVRIDDINIVKELMSYNRTFIAPVLVRPNQLWSNFWGALNESGFSARSHDYLDIVKGSIQGMFNVPYASSCYMIKKSAFKKLRFDHPSSDPDMTLCEQLRKEGIFINVVNTKEYGHLINAESFNTSLTSPDFYMLLTNRVDWEKKYIHPDYIKSLEPGTKHIQPCPDVYWFPIGTEQFCDDIVAIMENFGKWSNGTNEDTRVEGGYEAVPTRDIHMHQVGLDPLWLKFLQEYVRPLQKAVFLGYHDRPKSLMNFVVRYRPDEQPSLKPHHDWSTYTINIALNRAGTDYTGGGCRFVRYNCSVIDTKKGWLLMHPGTLTHLHEGLVTTSGTRYIMISFVDP